jgi:Tfp pilus assembly pilus retraction ATPase PilT
MTRAQQLLEEAAARGVRSFSLSAKGDGAALSLRTRGGFERDERVLPDFAGLVTEFDALAPDKMHQDEFEWEARVALSVEGRQVWFDLWWFRDKGKNGFIGYVFDPNLRVSFDQLGLSERDAKTLDELTSFPSGVVVGCGCVGSGHGTTQMALLERMGQHGRRVVSLYDWSHPHLRGVTQIELDPENIKEQVASLAADFDVFALPNLRNDKIVHAAFDLASSGHLVLSLIYSYPVETALYRFLDLGVSPDELRAHFLGGWSQTLVHRAGGKDRIGVFNCMSRDEAQHQTFERVWLSQQIDQDEFKRAWWRDIERKIERGDILREDVPDWLNP